MSIELTSEQIEMLAWAIDLAKDAYFDDPTSFEEGQYEALDAVSDMLKALTPPPDPACADADGGERG